MENIDVEDVLEYLLSIIEKTRSVERVKEEIISILADIKEQKFYKIRTRLGRTL